MLAKRCEYLNGSLFHTTDYINGNEADDYDGSGALVAKKTYTIANTGTAPTSGTNYNSWQYNEPNQVNYYDKDGTTLLESQTISWVQAAGCQVNCSTVQQVITTMDAMVKESDYTYDPYNNVNDEKDYDWGGGAKGGLLREIQTSYVTNPAYTNLDLVSLPAETKSLNGAGVVYSDTQFGYDETNMANAPNVIEHDNSIPVPGVRGNLTTVKRCLNPASCTWIDTTYVYDITGNVVTETDADGHATSYSYADNYSDGVNRNSYGFVTAIANALGQSPYQANYDYGAGQPELMADIMGQYRTRSYEASGYGMDRLAAISYANGAHTYYSYPSTTEVVTQQDQNNSGDEALKWETRYDQFGRPTETDTFESSSQYIARKIGWKALGRLFWVDNPSRPGDGLDYQTTYVYDGLNRVTKITGPDGSVTPISYSGNQKTVTDPADKVKVYTYDALGRLTNVREDPSGLNYTTDYQYDPLGDLTLVSQGYCPNCEQRHFVYDSLGRLIQATNPESGTVTYGYDGVGNMKSRTDARGVTTTYTYDALSRLTGKSYSDGTPSVTYTYGTAGNSTGHLIAVQVQNGSTTNFTSFDAMGNVLASNHVTAGQTYSFAYAYNLAGALTSETYPSGRVLNIAHDGADRPYALSGILSGQTTNYVTQTAYWPQGEIYYFVRGNTVWHAASYNKRLQPTESYEALNNNSGSMLFVSCPNWGVNDNQNVYDICPHASTTNDDGTLQSYNAYNGGPGYPQFLTFSQNFAYDGANRLTSANDSGGWSRNFGYDQYGNMWVTGSSGIGTGSMPTSNVYDPSTNRVVGGSYDNAGNQTVVNLDTLAYDAENRMTSAYDSVTHNTEEYSYDGAGQRVEKSGPGGTTVYVYDAFGQLAAEYSTVPQNPLCTTCYLSYDHLGSVRLVTDQSGSVVARHDYLPFGTEVPANTVGRNGDWGPKTDVEQKFTGQIRDTETGMDYFHARYYTNALGRFNSPDPANAGADPNTPQSWNGYAYLLGNPLNATDPLGLFAEQHPNPPMPLYPVYWYYMNSLEDWLFTIIENSEQNNNTSVGGVAPTPPSKPSEPQQPRPVARTCAVALQVARQDAQAVQRANASWLILSQAGKGNSINPSLLAAIGVRETGFRNISERDGAGVGVGVFQITVNATSGVTVAQASNLPWAANYAANMLASNRTYLSRRFPNFNPGQLLQATAASYNMNPYKPGNFTGNPNMIDIGTAHNNYGSNVVSLMTCFGN